MGVAGRPSRARRKIARRPPAANEYMQVKSHTNGEYGTYGEGHEM
jgi:hypothetical protein